MRYFYTLLLSLCTTVILADEAYFHSAPAKKGDGIYSLLRRYHLSDHACNLDQFLELNQLQSDDELKAEKKYKLPILIYRYNGTSIRTTVGIDSWEQAVRIKAYNDKILSDKLRKTQYVDSKILWVPYSELNCATETVSTDSKKLSSVPKETKLPAGKNYLSIDLFGKENKLVEIKNKDLKGKVYYIVSGHGGPDPGAMCTECSNSLCEDEYAYDVCLRLTRELISRGATAHMIIQDKNDGIRDGKYLECDHDEVCMGARIPVNQKKRLHQRAAQINNLYGKYKKQGVKDQIAIMVHVDSNTKEKRQDVYFFHHLKSKSSKSLANAMQDTFKEKYNYYQKDRGYKGFVKGRGLYMLNNTLPTATYVELANIRNPHDHKRLLLDSNREALAKWLFEGILKYQGIKI